MPILFQYRNIRHDLGMYITKQAEQEMYLIAQGSTNTHTQLPKLPMGAFPYLSGMLDCT